MGFRRQTTCFYASCAASASMFKINPSAALSHGIDNFAMRNSTKDALFDDTLPNGVGVMEAGYREPVAVTKLRWKTGSDAEDI
jgi:hypothetical protein